MFAIYFSVFIGIVLAQLAPGPNLLAVANTALGQGRRTALRVVVGVATGTFIWVMCAAVGLGQVVAAFPATLMVLKLVGGSYLLFIAYKSLKSAFAGGTGDFGRGRPRMTDSAAVRYGLFVVLTNPKSILFWSSVATFLFGAGMNSVEVLALGPVSALSSVCVYGSYAMLFSARPAIGVYARFARALEAAFAATFGALGGLLIWAGLQELRR
ncbi:MAG: LysE family translocator [Hyphomicrobiaceae bacterium]|nr:LysE family translocator [Hyphomicrobiaceae bacterium]